MKILANKIEHTDILKHETKKHVLVKFVLVLLLFGGYFFFITAKYGLGSGFMVTALTWSFFVLCTPVADAGFLLDFPFRLITGVKMLFSEIMVWLIAVSLNIYIFLVHPQFYTQTKLLLFFKNILSHPIPFWGIIMISALGTFMSILFGDELLDKAKHRDRNLYHRHKHRYKYLAMVFVIFSVITLYDLLLKKLGIVLPV